MRRRAPAVLLTLLLSGGVMSVAGFAWADARTEARSHYKKGLAAINAGDYESGVSELKRAYEILPHPNVLYNIAKAYSESGDLEGAIAYYRRYLDGNPADRDEVKTIVESIDLRLTRQRAAKESANRPVAPVPTPGAPMGDPQEGVATAPQPTGAPSEVEDDGERNAKAPASARTEDVFEETVVTASRAAQSPLDAPNSTSIITEQDIRLSGLTKIPELLRRLAGVDILQGTGAQTEVSLRGFNQRLSNRILVLVNGRSVYLNLLGATIWATLSVGVEDIERIEVVRGPGAALYGADALNGVVNIITKAPGEGRSGVAAGFGDHQSTHASLWATGRTGELAWRAAAGYDYLPRWSRDVTPDRRDVTVSSGDQDQSQRTIRLDLRTTRTFGRDVTVGVGGGLVRGSFDTLGTGPLTNVLLDDLQSSDVTAFVNTKHFQLRSFWNQTTARNANNVAYAGQQTFPAHVDLNVLDVEGQYVSTFETGQGIHHDLHAGISYRFKSADWSYLDRPRTENHGALFVHDEIKLGAKFGIVGDYRVDYVPYLARTVHSPKGSLLFHPTPKSTLRAVVATAFRKPTFLESYIALPIQLPLAGGEALGRTASLSDPNYRLREEKVLTAELGYLNQDSDFFVFDSAVFYNRLSDITEIASTGSTSLGDVAAGRGGLNTASGLYPLINLAFRNQCQRYDLFGGEVGARVFPAEGLDVYANYTLNVVSQDESGCGAGAPPRVKDERTSVHKLNGGVQVRTRAGVDGSFDVHYVSAQKWVEQNADVATQTIVAQQYPLSDYFLLNARTGYRFLANHAEVSVMAFNLLGTEHRQHPFGQVVGRRVMGQFSYTF